MAKATTVRFKCLLCKATRSGTVISPIMRDANEPVVRCTTCKLIQMQAIPSKQKLQRFYDQGKQAGNIGVKIDLAHLWTRQKDDTMRRVELAETLLDDGAEVLDIGSGYGFFLREMNKKGFKTEGVEVSKLSRGVSKKNSPARVTETIQKKKYDLITLFFVLEHIPDPIGYIKKLRSHLKPGGTIILEIPNARDHMLALSPAYKAFYWQFAHCFYPDASTMNKIVAKTGFKKVHDLYVQRYGAENKKHWIEKKGPQIAKPSYTAKSPAAKKAEAAYKRKLETTGAADTLITIISA